MNSPKPMLPTTDLRIEWTLLALLALFWGSSYLLIKIAVASIPPITLIAIRVTVALVFLLCVMYFQALHFPRDWETWKKLLVQSFFNSIASWTILAWGQQYVESSLAGVLNSTSPIFVCLLTHRLSASSSGRSWKLFGSILGIVGVAIVVGIDVDLGGGSTALGLLAVLVGAFLYACAAMYGKSFSNLSHTVTAAGTMAWASAFLIPASIVIDRPWNLSPSPGALLAALTLGVVCTGIALQIYFRLAQTLGALGVASQSYLRSTVSVLLGILVLDEKLTSNVLLGLVIVIASIVIINTNVPAVLRGRR